ncbi:hypothetical protein QO239_23440 [Cupriavidus taiwanensis]|uniref:hypothetical protein n=1 Tax=Cupriavidus taiwanensis TaxID=164546 RepID=UPI0025411AD6|nr:hypothetical protein [Cupriavidus taiwanensis]MDK3025553.1 hypothetical protein [Cupriavidus taiwanensis]
MKPRFSFLAFLHTRLGILVWTLLVAVLAYQLGQSSNPTQGVKSTRPRVIA